jgi:hypothetical protein
VGAWANLGLTHFGSTHGEERSAAIRNEKYQYSEREQICKYLWLFKRCLTISSNSLYRLYIRYCWFSNSLHVTWSTNSAYAKDSNQYLNTKKTSKYNAFHLYGGYRFGRSSCSSPSVRHTSSTSLVEPADTHGAAILIVSVPTWPCRFNLY